MNEFIAMLAPYAMKHGKAFNILPSLILAQGILETGGGTSELAKQANNLFGIKKGGEWDGEVHIVVTGEYRTNADGEDEYYEIVAEFRKYDSYEGAVIDLCKKYNTMSRYEAVPGNFVFADVSQAVKDAGYATDPKYPAKLQNIYSQYNLAQYDVGFVAEVIEDVIEDLEEVIEIIEEEPSMVLKVVVDAGHGKFTAGKRTPAGEREWTFNDAVVRALIAELENYEGVEVLRVDDPTGNTDVSLQSRTNKANAWGGDVYVSVHHNANTGRWGTWTGSETFVYSTTTSSDGSWKLAQAVHPRLVKAMGLKDRGIKKANFHVLRETRMPAILTEGGYMDSTIDIVAMRNSTKLRLQGAAIAQGIVAYGGLKRKSSADVKPVVNPSELYRVRTAWDEADSQKGAFADIDGAIAVAQANPGYEVYDANGKQVYPKVVTASNPTPVADELYRVRKSWADADSQIGAFADPAGAKELADKGEGYKVFAGNGSLFYDPKEAAREAEEAAAKAERAKARAQYDKDYQEAIKLGITDGSKPLEAPTREQVAVMMVRLKRLMDK